MSYGDPKTLASSNLGEELQGARGRHQPRESCMNLRYKHVNSVRSPSLYDTTCVTSSSSLFALLIDLVSTFPTAGRSDTFLGSYLGTTPLRKVSCRVFRASLGLSIRVRRIYRRRRLGVLPSASAGCEYQVLLSIVQPKRCVANWIPGEECTSMMMNI